MSKQNKELARAMSYPHLRWHEHGRGTNPEVAIVTGNLCDSVGGAVFSVQYKAASNAVGVLDYIVAAVNLHWELIDACKRALEYAPNEVEASALRRVIDKAR